MLPKPKSLDFSRETAAVVVVSPAKSTGSESDNLSPRKSSALNFSKAFPFARRRSEKGTTPDKNTADPDHRDKNVHHTSAEQYRTSSDKTGLNQPAESQSKSAPIVDTSAKCSEGLEYSPNNRDASASNRVHSQNTATDRSERNNLTCSPPSPVSRKARSPASPGSRREKKLWEGIEISKNPARKSYHGSASNQLHQTPSTSQQSLSQSQQNHVLGNAALKGDIQQNSDTKDDTTRELQTKKAHSLDDSTDIHISEPTSHSTPKSEPVVVRRTETSVVKPSRATKAQSWCVTGPVPVAPPRRRKSSKGKQGAGDSEDPSLGESLSPNSSGQFTSPEVSPARTPVSSPDRAALRAPEQGLSSAENSPLLRTGPRSGPIKAFAPHSNSSSAQSTPTTSPSPQRPPRRSSTKKKPAPAPPIASPLSPRSVELNRNRLTADTLRQSQHSPSPVAVVTPSKSQDFNNSNTPQPLSPPVPPRPKRSSKKVKLVETKHKFKTVDEPVSPKKSLAVSSKAHSVPAQTFERLLDDVQNQSVLNTTGESSSSSDPSRDRSLAAELDTSGDFNTTSGQDSSLKLDIDPVHEEFVAETLKALDRGLVGEPITDLALPTAPTNPDDCNHSLDSSPKPECDEPTHAVNNTLEDESVTSSVKDADGKYKVVISLDEPVLHSVGSRGENFAQTPPDSARFESGRAQVAPVTAEPHTVEQDKQDEVQSPSELAHPERTVVNSETELRTHNTVKSDTGNELAQCEPALSNLDTVQSKGCAESPEIAIVQEEQSVLQLEQDSGVVPFHSVHSDIYTKDTVQPEQDTVHAEAGTVQSEPDAKENIVKSEQDIVQSEQDIVHSKLHVHTRDTVQPEQDIVHSELGTTYTVQPEQDLVHSGHDSVHSEQDVVHSELSVSDTAQPEQAVHFEQDIVHSEQDIVQSEQDIVHSEQDSFHSKPGTVQPDLEPVQPEQDSLQFESVFSEFGSEFLTETLKAIDQVLVKDQQIEDTEHSTEEAQSSSIDTEQVTDTKEEHCDTKTQSTKLTETTSPATEKNREPLENPTQSVESGDIAHDSETVLATSAALTPNTEPTVFSDTERHPDSDSVPSAPPEKEKSTNQVDSFYEEDDSVIFSQEDQEEMEAKKRELDQLRAQFFKPKAAVAVQSMDDEGQRSGQAWSSGVEEDDYNSNTAVVNPVVNPVSSGTTLIHISNDDTDHVRESSTNSYNHENVTVVQHSYSEDLKPQTTSKIVLDLDEDQFVPQFNSAHSVGEGTSLTAEDEMFFGNNSSMGNDIHYASSEGKTEIFLDSLERVSGSGRGNTNERRTNNVVHIQVTDSLQDRFLDDSDISDNEGYFQASFDPQSGRVEEEEDGITLVSYQPTSTSPPSTGVLLDFPGSSSTDDAATGDLLGSFDATPLQPLLIGSGHRSINDPKHRDDHEDTEGAPPPLPTSPPPKPNFAGAPPLPMSPPPPCTPDKADYTFDSDLLDAEHGRGHHPGVLARAAYDNTDLISTTARGSGNGSAETLEAGYSGPKSNKTDGPVAVPVRLEADGSESMDPKTGLRKTGVSTPVEKALIFAESTETTIRFRKREKSNEDDNNEGDVINDSRREIMESNRMTKKSVSAWTPDQENEKEEEGNIAHMTKSESEVLYEERKMKRDEAQNNVPTVVVIHRQSDLGRFNIYCMLRF